MLYIPKYCCNCGEKIDRDDWKPWTSRRFCIVCESEQKHHELLPRGVVLIGVFLALFGVSGYLRRPAQPPTQQVAAAPLRSSISQPAPQSQAAQAAEPLPAPANAKAPAPAATPPIMSDRKAQTAAEPVYFCGAATKKGTPCSRRVKTPGRCWQHQGQPSITETIAGKKR